MGQPPRTRVSLLIRLRNSEDDLAWAEFVELYAPLIYEFACKQGIQDADAADLTQEVLRAVARAIKQFDYDSQRGTFRGWLFTLVRNKIRNFLVRRKRHCQGSGDSAVQQVLAEHPAPQDDEEELWERECERRRFNWAAERVRTEVRDSTWQAFWRTAVEGQSGQEVAEALGLRVASVYVAKGRVMARIKEHLKYCPLE